MFPGAKHQTASKSPQQKLHGLLFPRRAKHHSVEKLDEARMSNMPLSEQTTTSEPQPSSSTPSSQRKAQWRMRIHAPIVNFFSKSHSPQTSIPKLTIRQPSLDHPDEDEPSTQSPSSDHDVIREENLPVTAIEPPSSSVPESSRMTSRFPLWKLKPRDKTVSSTSSSDSAWKSMDSYTWRSTDGVEIQLKGTRLEYMSEAERQALQKLSMQKLQRANLGCGPITKPKDPLQIKQKRLKLKQASRANTVSVVEKKSQQKNQQDSQVSLYKVFNIPIQECILNDILRQREAAEQRCKSLDQQDISSAEPLTPFLDVPKQVLKPRLSAISTKSTSSEPEISSSLGTSRHPSTSSTQGSNEAQRYPSSDNLLNPQAFLCGSTLHDSPDHRAIGSQTVSGSISVVKQDSFEPRSPQVPRIVETCTEYLRRHGLTTIGLFRQSGSAKRCRQMRVELDSGSEIIIDEVEELQPHDIATLLKEYFRDLPNPLLSKELYAAFVAVGKLPEERKWDKIEYIRCLVSMLSLENSDTLLVLLKFLQEVSKHANDFVTDDGTLVSGNKMNNHNLATVFGPTILRQDSAKPETTLSDNEPVVNVVQLMIKYVDDIFAVSKEVQQQLYQNLRESEPDQFDHVMNRLQSQSSGEPESSESQTETTIYYSTQEEDFPNEVVRDSDGNMIVKTRHATTHRIVYKINRGNQRSDRKDSQTDDILVALSGEQAETNTDQRQGNVDLAFAFDDEDSATADLGETPPPRPRISRNPLAKLGTAISRFRSTDSPR